MAWLWPLSQRHHVEADEKALKKKEAEDEANGVVGGDGASVAHGHGHKTHVKKSLGALLVGAETVELLDGEITTPRAAAAGERGRPPTHTTPHPGPPPQVREKTHRKAQNR